MSDNNPDRQNQPESPSRLETSSLEDSVFGDATPLSLDDFDAALSSASGYVPTPSAAPSPSAPFGAQGFGSALGSGTLESASLDSFGKTSVSAPIAPASSATSVISATPATPATPAAPAAPATPAAPAVPEAPAAPAAPAAPEAPEAPEAPVASQKASVPVKAPVKPTTSSPATQPKAPAEPSAPAASADATESPQYVRKQWRFDKDSGKLLSSADGVHFEEDEPRKTEWTTPDGRKYVEIVDRKTGQTTVIQCDEKQGSGEQNPLNSCLGCLFSIFTICVLFAGVFSGYITSVKGFLFCLIMLLAVRSIFKSMLKKPKEDSAGKEN